MIEGYANGNLQSKLTGDIIRKKVKEAGSSFSEILPNENSAIGTAESVALYNSVKKYRGFYIARYEAGINGTSESSSNNDSQKQIQDGSQKPVSKKNVGVWNFIPWGGKVDNIASDGLVGNDNDNGAVKVSRAMYNNNSKTNIKSTLCYDVQWDATVKFIGNNDKDYVKNSTNKGNFTNSLIKTGEFDEYSLNNIYDMAGNVYEWTMGAREPSKYESASRVLRGGCIGINGNITPVSFRSELTPDNARNVIGFRVALYLE